LVDHGEVIFNKGKDMHIEPGLVNGVKIALSYATAPAQQLMVLN